MKLTKKKALEIAIELWEWIVDNPGKLKHEWTEWEKYGRMLNSCPLCEYACRADCIKCPLKWGYYGCEDNDISQYIKWHDAINEGAKNAAHAAAVEFLAQLKELK